MNLWQRVREDIDGVFARDPAARSRFEIALTYPGIHAIWWHRLAHALWGWRLRLLARLVAGLGRWLTGIEIHPAAKIGRRFFIDHGMGVVIGETAEIGDDCTLYHGVTLGGTHWSAGKRHPTLGDGVVIGAGAKVLGPIVLGDGVRVGSNAVVLKDAPAGATLVGIPARIVGRRPEISAQQARIAERLGFDAYGMAQDMPDPVAEVVDRLLDHVQAADERLMALTQRVRALQEATGLAQDADVGQEDRPLPSLAGCHLADDEQAIGCPTPDSGTEKQA
ncbi:serine O-acetyltransferase [Halothiobacillus diazotrophicus]|uniref:Serine acetyltransferase n=1 Tax=Halothiobacillus diazotrophicus TaxID=1860122 RepID=A0A191ZI57_9GAMM|nr:serine O-acetyltransferase [Halothiobacillus diazotrophicus]